MKLSIITINLNNREGFRKTAESVVCQTFADYEWIVIDGGSTDGSLELIEQYSGRINYWVSEPDGGIYHAMNKGIRCAKGEYCFFLNSGDWLVDGDVLSKVFAIKFDEDVIYGFLLFDRGDRQETGVSPKQVSLRLFVESTIHHSGNSFIRREAFDSWGLYDENLKIVSDWKWFLQAIGLGSATARYIDILLSVFQQGGISSDPYWIEERNRVLKEIVPARILVDYMQFHGLENKLYEQQLEIRSSVTYRVGYYLLAPLKWIRRCIGRR